MKDVLIIWGGPDFHTPEEGAKIVDRMLRDNGLTVDVTSDYAAFADPTISERKLVVPIISGGTIEKEVRNNLVRAVRNGTGLGSYHGGLATSFPGDPTWHYMAGVTWVQHPGDMRDYTVEVVAPNDPIMTGIPASFPYHSEQYYILFDQSVEILATTTFDGVPDPVVKGITVPVVYKRMFEKGRVFYTSLGHSAVEFADANMRTILERGLLWAAGR